MRYYIQNGESCRDIYYLPKLTKHHLPSLKNEDIDRRWIGFALNIINDLSTDFNLYMFFTKTTPNMPSRFFFMYFAESMLGLSKLLDKRRKNKLCIINILNNYEQNIKNEQIRNKFVLFKKDIFDWLETKSDFINNLKVIRDKFLAHIDIEKDSIKEWKSAISQIKIGDIIEIANTTIEIYIALIKSLQNVRIPNNTYNIDEFKLIYECLRSLDKIEIYPREKNIIIHNIDLQLQEIKRLIKPAEQQCWTVSDFIDKS